MDISAGLVWSIVAHTPTRQFKAPLQSPDKQALPWPEAEAVPSSLKEQLVRPHTRPCQSSETVWFLVSPGFSWKPFSAGPVPDWVEMPGQMLSGQWFVTSRGVMSSFLRLVFQGAFWAM